MAAGQSSREWQTWAYASQEMMPQAKPDSAPLTAPARVALFLHVMRRLNKRHSLPVLIWCSTGVHDTCLCSRSWLGLYSPPKSSSALEQPKQAPEPP